MCNRSISVFSRQDVRFGSGEYDATNSPFGNGLLWRLRVAHTGRLRVVHIGRLWVAHTGRSRVAHTGRLWVVYIGRLQVVHPGGDDWPTLGDHGWYTPGDHAWYGVTRSMTLVRHPFHSGDWSVTSDLFFGRIRRNRQRVPGGVEQAGRPQARFVRADRQTTHRAPPASRTPRLRRAPRNR